MSTVEILTERLILRHPVLEDAVEINRAKNEVWTELQKWMVWSHDGQQTLDATKSFISTIGQDSLVGFCRESGRFVVSTGLMRLETPDEYSTGYWVAKDFLGKGYATEATAACVHYAFEQLKARVIHIGYLEGNAKSRRIIEKLGFGNEVFRNKSFACCYDGRLVDEYEFTMTDVSALPKIEYEWRGQW